MPHSLMLPLWTLLGLCVGSFLNVLIFRLPLGQEFVRAPSHCMACGHRLRWFELVPVLSWLVQQGRCRACGAPVSAQYPLVELLNAGAWLLTGALLYGESPLWMVLYSAFFSTLLVIGVIDWRTFEIPNGLNLFLLLLGLVQLAADRTHAATYLVGMVSVSGVFLLLWLLTGGRGLGLGDVKLMAAAGLLLGWPRTLLAMTLGSILGVVVHLWRMGRGAGRKLAYGPYLAVGLWVSALFGNGVIRWYLGLFGL